MSERSLPAAFSVVSVRWSRRLAAQACTCDTDAWIVAGGLATVLLVFVRESPIRLDHFDLPKEVALGFLGVLCCARLWWVRPRSDLLLEGAISGALLWGIVHTVVSATNYGSAWRTTGGFAAAASVFWLVRSVTPRTRARLYHILAVIFVVVAAIALLEGLGAVPFISEPGRRPGGTLGNRNVMARCLCLGLPLCWRLLFLSTRPSTRAVATIAVTVLVAAIVLSRSRGVWLTATIVALLLPTLTAAVESRAMRLRFRYSVPVWLAAIVTGAVAAVVVPNNLGWRPSAFQASAETMFQYESGTGRGRIIQAMTTWRMIVANPMGVGPGQWSVRYPAYASADDPSMSWRAFYPGPQVPRNEFLSLIAEFGVPVLLFMIAVASGIVMRVVKQLRCQQLDDRQSGVLALGTTFTVLVLGIFDSILRVPPTLALGAAMMGLAMNVAGTRSTLAHGATLTARLTGRRILTVGYMLASLAYTNIATRDLAAMYILQSMTSLEDVYRAAMVAPHNVEPRILLSIAFVTAGRCDLAKRHLDQASRLQPSARIIRHLRAGCDAPSR